MEDPVTMCDLENIPLWAVLSHIPEALALNCARPSHGLVLFQYADLTPKPCSLNLNLTSFFDLSFTCP